MTEVTNGFYESAAELNGLDPTYISGIERGRRNPSLKNIVKIAQALENIGS